VAGPVAGGVLIGVMGSANVFILDGVSYFISALLIARVNLREDTERTEPETELGPQDPPDIEHSVAHQAWAELAESLREGWDYVKTEPSLLYLMAVSFCLNFVFAPLAILMPILAKEVLGAGAQGYGILSAGFSAGMLVGSLIIGNFRKLKPSTALPSFVVFQGLLVAGAGFTGRLWGATGCFLAAGLFNAMINVLVNTIFQQLVPNDKLGRVNALVSTASTGSQPLAYALSGWIADLAPIPYLLGGMGLLFALGGLAITQITAFQRFDEIHEQLQREREVEGPETLESGGDTVPVDGNS
jgi:hypothetical protein